MPLMEPLQALYQSPCQTMKSSQSHSTHDPCSVKQNYDTHDKELLAVFVAFKRRCNYLEGSTHPVDMVTEHKNLEHFTMTIKLMMCKNICSKFLSLFNLNISFRPR